MLIIGSDHAGYDLKENIKKKLEEHNIKYLDVSLEYNDKDDYPDIAYSVTKKVLENNENLGIAICGTGIGISIACNKVKKIRASVITDLETVMLSRKHNDLNVMCLGGRLNYTKDIDKVFEMINTFLNTKFEGERHMIRLDKITKIENNNMSEI